MSYIYIYIYITYNSAPPFPRPRSPLRGPPVLYADPRRFLYVICVYIYIYIYIYSQLGKGQMGSALMGSLQISCF